LLLGYGLTQEGKESCIGNFEIVLPLRVLLHSNDLLLQFIDQIQQQKQLIAAHRYYYEREAIQTEALSPPVASTLCTCEITSKSFSSLLPSSLRDSIFHYPSSHSLALHISVIGTDSCQLRLDYDISKFERDIIASMLGNIGTLTENLPNNLERKISELPILSDADQELLLEKWNTTSVPIPNRCAYHLFEEVGILMNKGITSHQIDEANCTSAQFNGSDDHR